PRRRVTLIQLSPATTNSPDSAAVPGDGTRPRPGRLPDRNWRGAPGRGNDTMSFPTRQRRMEMSERQSPRQRAGGNPASVPNEDRPAPETASAPETDSPSARHANKPPSARKLKTLTRWARVAFVVRCARRVRPLWKVYQPSAPDETDRLLSLS